MNQGNKPSRLRARTLLKGLAALVALAWFSRYAYVRVTTPAPDARARLAQLAEHLRPALVNDGTEAIAQAITDLPALPTFNEQPPAGWRWVFRRGTAPPLELTIVIHGPWKPDERPLLRMAFAYLNDPATTTVLERIHAVRGMNWRFSWQYETGILGAIGADGVPYSGFRNLAKLLVARSRYCQAHLQDIEGAWDDLKTVLLLCDGASCGATIDHLLVVGCEAVALNELHHLLLESKLDEPLAEEIGQTLRSLRPPIETSVQSVRWEAERTHWVIDSLFTDDGRGGGRLLLSEWEPIAELTIRPGMPGAPVWGRSPLWNVASGFFNDRRIVEAKWARRQSALEDAILLPYPEARAALEGLSKGGVFNLLDGPQLTFLEMAQNLSHVSGAYKFTFRLASARGAARIMVALNQFHSAHGRYPYGLLELVPDYLPELPPDPFCGRPFGYRAEPTGTFTLYSCGEDANDDGGLAREARSNAGAGTGVEGFDEVYTLPRPEYAEEPRVEPIPNESTAGQPGSGGAP